MKKTIVIILYILAFIFLSETDIHAANYGLSITPPLLRVHIKPGKSITQVFKIENLSASEKTLIANIVPFSEADNFGNPVLNPKASAPWLSYFGLANSQIKFNEPFTLASGASEQLILSLSIPESASLQDIYSTLMVSTYENSLGQTFQGTSVRATIGSNLLITISSYAFPDTDLKVIDFSPTEGSFIKIGNMYFLDSITPIKFSASIKNEGSFAAESKGVFRITTGNNKPIFLEGILPVNVIAKSQRQLLNTSGSLFDFTPSLSNVGLHQATLEIKTDNSNTQSSINIFFFPLKLSLGLILVLIIIITIVKNTSNSTNHSVDNDKAV